MKKRLLHLSFDRGDTLIEVLVTVVIMGIGMVAIVGGVATSIFMSTFQRQQASEQTLLRSYADAVEGSPNWTACATASYYSPGGAGANGWTIPAAQYGTGYSATSSAPLFWSPSSGQFNGSCTPDPGLQKVTIKVTSSRASETMDIVKRRP